MILVHNYALAIICFFFTMICWGSWANCQKLAAKTWRFELFYWDFVIGLILTALIGAFTVGSIGNEGRPFLEDLAQADTKSILYALSGGIIWNLGTLLLTAAMAVAGMAVGFPLGGGLAWILGIVFNFILVVLDKGKPEGNVFLLFLGVAVIIAAIAFNAMAYKKLASEQKKKTSKGIILAVCAGLAITFFYGFVVKSLDNEFVTGGTGKLTPFTGVFIFAVGALLSTPIFNTIAMRHPVEGKPVYMKEYFRGNFKTHLTGILGGIIWMSGMEISFMAAGASNPAISYALSNGAPLVAMFWGVFIWKEFKDAPKGTNKLLTAMFLLFILGLALITWSNA